MNTKRLTHFALAVLVGLLVGWAVANTYAPRQIEREALMYGKLKESDANGNSHYMVYIAVDGGMVVEVPREDYLLVHAVQGPIVYTEYVEWFTDRHYSWRIRVKPFRPISTLPTW